MTVKSDEPLSIIRQLELMRDLQRLANDRWQEENRIETELADGLRTAEQARDAAPAKSKRGTLPLVKRRIGNIKRRAIAPSANTKRSETRLNNNIRACGRKSNRNTRGCSRPR